MDKDFAALVAEVRRSSEATQSALASIQSKYNDMLQKSKEQDREIQRLRAENETIRNDPTVNERMHIAQQTTASDPVARSGEGGVAQFQEEKVISIHTAPVHSVAMMAMEGQSSGATIGTASWDATVNLYNLDNARIDKTLGSGDQKMGGLYSVAFAKTAPHILGCTSNDKQVYLWDHTKAECVNILRGHTDEVNGIDFHASQQVVCTASDDSKVIVWDFKEGTTLRTLDKHTKAVYGCTFLGVANQYLIGTCCFDQITRIFDMRDKQIVATLHDHTDDVIGIDYSDLGSTIATGSDDGKLCLYDTRNWRKRETINTRDTAGRAASEVKRVGFSVCGKRLAAACSTGEVLVYDVEGDPKLIGALGGHTDCVFDIAWGVSKATGKRTLVSASHDHSCRYWKEV